MCVHANARAVDKLFAALGGAFSRRSVAQETGFQNLPFAATVTHCAVEAAILGDTAFGTLRFEQATIAARTIGLGALALLLPDAYAALAQAVIGAFRRGIALEAIARWHGGATRHLVTHGDLATGVLELRVAR